jgi:hypothetical protein
MEKTPAYMRKARPIMMDDLLLMIEVYPEIVHGIKTLDEFAGILNITLHLFSSINTRIIPNKYQQYAIDHFSKKLNPALFDEKKFPAVVDYVQELTSFLHKPTFFDDHFREYKVQGKPDERAGRDEWRAQKILDIMRHGEKHHGDKFHYICKRTRVVLERSLNELIGYVELIKLFSKSPEIKKGCRANVIGLKAIQKEIENKTMTLEKRIKYVHDIEESIVKGLSGLVSIKE